MKSNEIQTLGAQVARLSEELSQALKEQERELGLPIMSETGVLVGSAAANLERATKALLAALRAD